MYRENYFQQYFTIALQLLIISNVACKYRCNGYSDLRFEIMYCANISSEYNIEQNYHCEDI